MAFTPKFRNKVSVLALGTAAGMAMASGAMAQEVDIGFLGAITGPIAELVPPIVEASQMAADQINAAGGILDGQTVNLVVADTQCSSQGAVDGANRLVNVDQVAGIVGALCSGAAIAAANSVAIPANVVMISPSATSPEITNLDDNDTFFRVAPSDAYQGQVVAQYALDNGFDRVAVTYVNNDYGAGLADSFRSAYVERGGEITADLVHEENRSSYRSELATLAADDPEALVLFAYGGDSGLTMIRQSLENGFFDQFIGGDGMRNDVLIEQLGAENLNVLVTQPVSLPDNPALETFNEAFTEREQDPNSIFVAQAYDATMLIALAIQHMGGVDRDAMPGALRDVANAPGEEVGPGDWARAVELLAAGEDINYQGASGPIEFDAAGNVPGVVAEFLIEGDSFVQGDILEAE